MVTWYYFHRCQTVNGYVFKQNSESGHSDCILAISAPVLFKHCTHIDVYFNLDRYIL